MRRLHRRVLLCAPRVKAELEARNAVEQLDYIAYLVNDLGIREVRESHIQQLHAIAVEDIYPCGGRYRDATMRVKIEGSVHQIPHESLVSGLVRDMLDAINTRPRASRWTDYTRAAYAMWRLNWIHPFAGANGRTARALAYLVVCIGLGAMPPGVPTMPTLIARRHTDYTRCLRLADRAWEKGKVRVSAMTTLVRELLSEQLRAALDRPNRKFSRRVPAPREKHTK